MPQPNFDEGKRQVLNATGENLQTLLERQWVINIGGWCDEVMGNIP